MAFIASYFAVKGINGIGYFIIRAKVKSKIVKNKYINTYISAKYKEYIKYSSQKRTTCKSYERPRFYHRRTISG